MTQDKTSLICGVILAGGQARRMGGGAKYLLPLGGKSILQHVIERLRPQVDGLAFNAPQLPEGLDIPLIADLQPDEGPLGGILAALKWAEQRELPPSHVLTVSADTPFFPRDLTAKLAAASGRAPASATSGGRRHGTFSLWPLSIATDLEALFGKGQRSVNRALEQLGGITVEFPASPIDPFFNINTPGDLSKAQRLAERVETADL